MTEDEARKLIAQGINVAGVVKKIENRIVGFGIAYPFRDEDIFRSSVKLAYFLLPEFTGNGYGTEI